MSWEDDPYHDVAFAIGRSRRYHAFMREHYRRIADGVLAIQAITGASAFVALLPANANPWIARVLTAVVAVAATLDLVFRFAEKAKIHDDLCKAFTEVSACIAEWPADDEHLKQVRAERLRLEAREPTERRLIDLKAHNDESSARGVPYYRLLPLSFWQRSVLAYFFNFGEHALRRRKAQKMQNFSGGSD